MGYQKMMNDNDIIELFDRTNITLKELSRITGRTVQALMELLMKETV